MKRLVLLACLLAGGCATPPTAKLYEGPDRPARDVATIIVPYQVEIDDINGTKLPWRSGFLATEDHAYNLLPGRYVFRFRVSSPYEFGNDRPGIKTPRMEQAANLEGGHAYRFKTKIKGSDAATAEVLAWLEDTATGQPVDEQVAEPKQAPAPTQRPAAPEPVAPQPVPAPVVVNPEPEPVAVEAAAAAPAPAPEPEPKAAPAPAPAPAPASTTPDDLSKAWKDATPEQRAEFLQSIVKP